LVIEIQQARVFYRRRGRFHFGQVDAQTVAQKRRGDHEHAASTSITSTSA